MNRRGFLGTILGAVSAPLVTIPDGPKDTLPVMSAPSSVTFTDCYLEPTNLYGYPIWKLRKTNKERDGR